MTEHNATLCHTPLKKRFLTKGDAKQYLKLHQKYYSEHAPKLYIYKCSTCRDYHLSKTQRSQVKQRATPTLVLFSRFKALLQNKPR